MFYKQRNTATVIESVKMLSEQMNEFRIHLTHTNKQTIATRKLNPEKNIINQKLDPPEMHTALEEVKATGLKSSKQYGDKCDGKGITPEPVCVNYKPLTFTAPHLLTNTFPRKPKVTQADDGSKDTPTLSTTSQSPKSIFSAVGSTTFVSQQNNLSMTTSITGFNQMHSHSVDQQMPGPGFFSASDPTISKMTNDQPLQQFNPPSGADQPSEASSTQAVSAASVSGTSLFMMPKGQISTSFPLPMPGTAKPPSVSGMASAISQPPAAGKSPEKHADECDKETDGEGTTPETSFTDYKPLVSLPEVITKSGEEDESVMFNERAKLYRFVEKQWKERGVGTMKILHNEQTDTVRILMRRDQVLKVCANHRIKADMDIDYKDSSDTKTLTWRATDYTDEVPRLEQYCCRFKTPEIASDFKETFEKAKLIAERNVTPNKSRVTQADGGSKDTPPLYTTSQSSEPVFGSGVASSSGKSVFSFGSTTFGTKQTTSATNMLRSFALKSSEEKMGEHQKVFGGFTFTSPPLLTNNIPTVSKAKPDDETLSKNDDKPKPFAGFSFGSSPQKPGYGIKLDFNQRSSSPASAKLAAEPIETTENKDDFEQGNEKLFGEKGTLYVNNPESKEWKERGIGEIQILKDNSKAMYRILMLREQSQKVCADHCLTKNMKLLPMDGNKKSWCWFAEDFMNECESCIEQFAVRFKTEEVSSNFRKVFDECVAALSAITEKSSVTVPDQTGSLESQFKKKPGEWICDDCYVVNMADCKRCVACEALQPGEKEDTVPVMSSSSIILGTTGGFQFTGKTDQSFSFNKGSFQPGATSTTTTSTSSFTTAFDLTKFGTFPANPERENDALKKLGEKNNDKDDKAGTGKAFGGQFPPKSDELVKDNAAEKKCIASETVQSEEVYDKAPASCLTSFSSVSSTFKFGSSGGFNFTSSNIVSSGKFPFGLTVKEQDSSNGGAFQSRFEVPSESDDALKPLGMMDIGVAKSDPSGATTDKLKTYENTLKTPTTPLSPGDNGYYVNQEGEDDHIYFTPVIKLPENVKIKTGEEEEELLYYQRAKLFRFLDNEWKERGVGEVRILRHQQTGKTRILMRRDQVLKICMNHVIAGDIELKPMPNAKGKAWVWHAEDFAEDKLSHEQFAIRFASVELANQFKKVFDAAHNDPYSLPVVEHQPDMKQSKSDSKSSSAAQSETVTTPKSTAAMSFSFKSPDSRKDTHSSKFGENSSSDKVFCRFKSGVFGSSEVFGAFSDTEKLSTSKQDKSSKGTHESQLLAKLLAEPTKEAPSVATGNTTVLVYVTYLSSAITKSE
jgi:E3 SUMO-protein ligase RanBP2